MAERLEALADTSRSVSAGEATTEDRHVFLQTYVHPPMNSPVIGHVRPITAPVASQLADSRSDNQIQHWSYAE